MAPKRRRIVLTIILAGTVLALFAIDQLVRCSPRGQTSQAPQIADQALGATLEPLDRGTADALGLSSDTRGLVVTSLSSNGAAARSGVRAGDVVEKVGSEPVYSLDEASAAIGIKPRALTLTLNRHRHYVIVRIRTWSSGERQGVE